MDSYLKDILQDLKKVVPASWYAVTIYVKIQIIGTPNYCCDLIVWAASSEFVSSSIPWWQILTARAQPFRKARDLVFCLKVPLDSLLVWASSEGSGETARMRRLAWTFAARIGYKYQIRLTRSSLKFKEWFDRVQNCRQNSEAVWSDLHYLPRPVRPFPNILRH